MHDTAHLVSDVMTRTVVALGRGTTYKDIVRAMHRWKVSALPVLESGDRVVGVVSEADLLAKEEYGITDVAGPAKAGAVTAEQLMTAPAITVPEHASIRQAARIMALHQVKRLPVVDDRGALKGIVSRSDLLRVFLRVDEDIAEEVRREVVDVLFPAPAEPVRVEVRDGVVQLTGRIRDTTLVPVTARLVRAVEGVVDVRCLLAGPPRRPDLDPDLPDAERGRALPASRGS
ncbi:CBS domain-containing protein [Streptomyces sp. S.PB5]|uniref:CBS domain-containing protein n=1 Tax=Streptomyces sp. S.PB5 TaxID=3020844 RepID=UPI0025AFF4C4|nr:CBS domain-containing protein [Streptomyces sp. S.PB5]MDN3029174.1 CBS domain-containing protein [Streptomyces sp. S.PB5]